MDSNEQVSHPSKMHEHRICTTSSNASYHHQGRHSHVVFRVRISSVEDELFCNVSLIVSGNRKGSVQTQLVQVKFTCLPFEPSASWQLPRTCSNVHRALMQRGVPPLVLEVHFGTIINVRPGQLEVLISDRCEKLGRNFPSMFLEQRTHSRQLPSPFLSLFHLQFQLATKFDTPIIQGPPKKGELRKCEPDCCPPTHSAPPRPPSLSLSSFFLNAITSPTSSTLSHLRASSIQHQTQSSECPTDDR